MTQIKSFNELGVKAPESKSFTGEKIPVKKVLGKQIIIHDFKICPSKFQGTRADIQISSHDEKRVIFTGSSYLIGTLEKIPKESFPFSTTIVEQDEKFLFT
jgi:hypothetical protein